MTDSSFRASPAGMKCFLHGSPTFAAIYTTKKLSDLTHLLPCLLAISDINLYLNVLKASLVLVKNFKT